MSRSLTASPLVSCFALPEAEYYRRAQKAIDKEEGKRAKYNRPNANYGCEILWHPAFAAEYVAIVSGMQLPEIAPWLRTDGMRQEVETGPASEGLFAPYDFYDCCYLADVLRDGLAGAPGALAALRLARALAWMERTGEALLPKAEYMAIAA